MILSMMGVEYMIIIQSYSIQLKLRDSTSSLIFSHIKLMKIHCTILDYRT